MTRAPKLLLPLAVVGSLLAPATPAAASTGSDRAVVDLTFDVTVAMLGMGNLDDSGGPLAPETLSRPTSAPLKGTSALARLGLTIAPGTTIAVSVFSSAQIHDSVCITGSSTKTKTAVYLSSKATRPTLVRPHGCSLPGAPGTADKPTAKAVAAQHVTDLRNDLRNVAISEESYATDHNGAFVADTLVRRGAKQLASTDVLAMEGARLTAGDSVIATLFTATVADDSFCLTGSSTTTKTVLYLSSSNDVATSHRPKECVAPAG